VARANKLRGVAFKPSALGTFGSIGVGDVNAAPAAVLVAQTLCAGLGVLHASIVGIQAHWNFKALLVKFTGILELVLYSLGYDEGAVVFVGNALGEG
jgi:hypothetical protein